MKSKQIIAAVFVSYAALSAGIRPAAAVEYTRVIADKSAIKFIYKQMNVPMEGSFGRYASQLRFDPAKPAAATASFQIDLASIDTGATDADEEVRGKLWFNTKTYPQASFVSTSVAPLGGNRFEVRGKLTMKGKTQDIAAPISFTQDGANGLFEGSFTIKRADFAIGEGAWADFATVANEIQIKVRLLAGAGGK
ncbi:YceI family protein [Uliginosibacterium sp. H3]|uniref:YceI family protein n=1 Tax=Uliginosibacterium silvisoli TaxID=3114758 RepID=A0ABU6K7H0_9RHOO|nr:YceI family protein [Uliginosibacterium sp. H3]